MSLVPRYPPPPPRVNPELFNKSKNGGPQRIENPSSPISRDYVEAPVVHRGGISPVSHRRDIDTHPPEPGQDAAFDAKVAAELRRMRELRGGEDVPGDGLNSPVVGGGCEVRGGEYPKSRDLVSKPETGVADPNFEDDVQKTMASMKKKLGIGDSPAVSSSGLGISKESRSEAPFHGGGSTRVPVSGAGNRVDDLGAGARGSTLLHAETDSDGGIVSQMDMRRAIPSPAGKGKSTGLRGMWGGDASDGLSGGTLQPAQHGRSPMGTREGDEVGPGHAGSVRPMRQGSGLKGMWDGDGPVPKPNLPHRLGPGLRSLWSGPDIAQEDAARTDSQAAYHRALDRDVQERQASTLWVGEDKGQQPWNPERDKLSSDGILAIPGIAGETHRAGGQGVSGSSLRVGGEDVEKRLVAKEKQAAYAELLRQQIAEKETRRAREATTETAEHIQHANYSLLGSSDMPTQVVGGGVNSYETGGHRQRHDHRDGQVSHQQDSDTAGTGGSSQGLFPPSDPTGAHGGVKEERLRGETLEPSSAHRWVHRNAHSSDQGPCQLPNQEAFHGGMEGRDLSG
ncbi:unnamed protein product, partial [Discosporangium mesarthrocarpum]